jgi:hypothetical protein
MKRYRPGRQDGFPRKILQSFVLDLADKYHINRKDLKIAASNNRMQGD